ncbi:MAG TPA: nitrogen fixation protein NifH, partial [Actinomycetota bacterium]|nr:nitrogen fixation protein NifH [Actinomycetota bacterium]
EWQARSITGERFEGYYRSGTTGPGFGCAVNGAHPCAWGAIKALRGLAAIPSRRRSPHVRRAIEEGVGFLLSRDPAVADYPTGTPVSSSWFRLGFPSGYVADVLQNLETLAELGRAGDPRLRHALEWLLSQQDEQGRWRNRYPYAGKLWAEVDRPGAPSKWVTLRACVVLKHAIG